MSSTETGISSRLPGGGAGEAERAGSHSIDLHTHSTASDGTLAPADLVARAAARGVRMLALTDHDTTAGLADAASAAAAHGVRLVSGIELSVLAEDKPLHIVGLGIDASSAAMQFAEAQLREIRCVRARMMGERLAKLGFAGAYDGACTQAGHDRPGRVHFARHLLACGGFREMADVFSRLLQRGKPAYVATKWPPLAQAVAWVNDAGGIAVLAHPLRYQLTGSWRRRVTSAFREAGGAAIEVVSGKQNATQTAAAADLARRFKLRGAVGSDFHSPGRPWSELGALPPLPADIEPVWQNL